MRSRAMRESRHDADLTRGREGMSIQVAEHTIIFTKEEDTGVRVVIQHPAGPQRHQSDELVSDPERLK